MSNFLKRLHQWTINHWFINTLLVAVPTLWFTVLQTVGKQMNLVSGNGDLYKVPLILFWICVFFSIAYSGVTSWADSYNSKLRKNGQLVLQNLLSSVNSVCAKKSTRFLTYLNAVSKQNFRDPFHEIIQPEAQIQSLIDELNVCLSNVLNINREDIGISVIYKYGGETAWNWLYKINISNTTDLNEIIGDARSTARQIIDRRTNFLFIADKRIGESTNQYRSGRDDVGYGKLGSILCRNISVEAESGNYISAVLSISTYGKQICEKRDEAEVKNLLDLALSPFDIRLKMELSLLYIKHKTNPNRVARGG